MAPIESAGQRLPALLEISRRDATIAPIRALKRFLMRLAFTGCGCRCRLAQPAGRQADTAARDPTASAPGFADLFVHEGNATSVDPREGCIVQGPPRSARYRGAYRV